MPYDDPHPSDPSELVGVGLPADAEATEEMAYTFAEEFAAIGRDAKWILKMFRSPTYAAAHQAYVQLGEPKVRAIVNECVDFFGRFRISVHEPRQSRSDLVTLRARGNGGKANG